MPGNRWPSCMFWVSVRTNKVNSKGPSPPLGEKLEPTDWFLTVRITANLAPPLLPQGNGFNPEVDTYRHLIAVKPPKNQRKYPCSIRA